MALFKVGNIKTIIEPTPPAEVVYYPIYSVVLTATCADGSGRLGGGTARAVTTTISSPNVNGVNSVTFPLSDIPVTVNVEPNKSVTINVTVSAKFNDGFI